MCTYSVFCICVAEQSLFILADYGKSYAFVRKREWFPLRPRLASHLGRLDPRLGHVGEYRGLTDACDQASELDCLDLGWMWGKDKDFDSDSTDR